MSFARGKVRKQDGRGRLTMSVTYFCPSCWCEVGTVNVCPKCGADLRDFAGETYEQKLIRALRHPEPTVPIQAAVILGKLGSRAAVKPLIELADSASDPYIQEAAVEALGRIADPRVVPCLERLSREGPVRVRAAAKQALKTLRGRVNATQE
jgi:HEAT repeats